MLSYHIGQITLIVINDHTDYLHSKEKIGVKIMNGKCDDNILIVKTAISLQVILIHIICTPYIEVKKNCFE